MPQPRGVRLGFGPSRSTTSKPKTGFIGRLSKRTRRRLIRTGIISANLVVLAVVLAVVLRSPQSTPVITSSITGDQTGAKQALDVVSSADIAVNAARLVNMPEATAVTNQADSVNAQLAVTPSDRKVVTKPQVVTTSLKSWRDIQSYVVQAGDTVGSLATKFNVSSDSIRWSNNITGDALQVGNKIYVPPVSGLAYAVKAGDTLDSLAGRYRVSKDQLIADNDIYSNNLKVGSVILVRDGNAAPLPVASPRGGSAVSRPATGFAWGGGAAIYGANGYDYGWCTWYAAGRRSALGRPVPSNLGNASTWYRIAQYAGLPTGLAPQPGAVAVNEGGNHVSVVEVVNGDGSFWISEMNSRGQVSMSDSTPTGGWGRVDWKLIPSPGYLKFVY